jgi:hypothetical protein
MGEGSGRRGVDSVSQHGMVMEVFSSFMVTLISGMSDYNENKRIKMRGKNGKFEFKRNKSHY